MAQLKPIDVSRLRGPVMVEAVLADFARIVDLFLTRTGRAGLARDKQDAVLASVHRLLGAEKSSIRYSDRYIIACQILSHCATPESVTCGSYATSAAACLEYILYVHEPQIVAEMVCDMAIAGTWKSPSGNIVKVHRLNLLPIILPIVDFGDDEEADSSPSFGTDVALQPKGIDRSYASHLAQLVLTNEMLSGMPGQFRYIVTKAASPAGMYTTITEGLYSEGKFVEKFVGVSLSHVRRCAEMFFGRDVLLEANDEVQLFELLYGSTGSLLASLGTVNGGVEWVAVKSFVAAEGRLFTFNPREAGSLASIGLQHFAQRIR